MWSLETQFTYAFQLVPKTKSIIGSVLLHSPHSDKSMLISPYIYTHTHTHLFLYLYFPSVIPPLSLSPLHLFLSLQLLFCFPLLSCRSSETSLLSTATGTQYSIRKNTYTYLPLVVSIISCITTFFFPLLPFFSSLLQSQLQKIS